MKCERCGKGVDKGWRFCPNCGSSVQNNIRSLFDDIFSRFRKEFSETSRMFDRDFEVLDISPFFRQDEGREEQEKRVQGLPPGMRRKGFTIKITRRQNQPPRVDVRTFGNVDKDEVRKGVSEAMRSIGASGLGPAAGIPRPEPRRRAQLPAAMRPDSMPSSAASPRQDTLEPSAEDKGASKPAKYTEEPETDIRSLGNRVVVEMKLPDVKSESDIRINQLQSSVEVRARAGDKVYFKIITKPEQLSVTSKRFEKGTLHIEFS